MTNDQTSAADCWTKFLNPETLRFNLILASMYMATWEIFEQGVVSQLKGFYLIGVNEETEEQFTKEYKAAVLSLDKSAFRASMLWFKESGAVDDGDLALADRARIHRNELAHNLPVFVASSDRSVDVALLRDMCALQNKIDVWWIRNVEIPANPDYDNVDVDAIPDSKIASGKTLILDLMLQIATGSQTDASQFYDEFVRAAESVNTPKSAR